MTRKEAAGVIKFEKACVLRQDTPRCNRDCKKCDLLLPTEDVLTAYDMAIKALEQKPTTKNCRTCRNFGSHHGICEICKDNRCWTEKEPTKNDLGVDCISRADVNQVIEDYMDEQYGALSDKTRERAFGAKVAKALINELPSVTPQETRWIPVGERLPEKNMECLVAVGRFNFTEIATYSDLMGIIDHKIFYQGDVGHDNFKNITQYVKAWMPLLKPYEPQESEDKE